MCHVRRRIHVCHTRCPQLALAKDKVNPEQHTCVTHRCPQLSLAKDKFISALLKCGVLVYSP